MKTALILSFDLIREGELPKSLAVASTNYHSISQSLNKKMRIQLKNAVLPFKY